MFHHYKKILGITVSFLYILVNYNFYNSIFHEYANDKIFYMTVWLGIMEVLFWIILFYSVFDLENRSIEKIENNEIKDREKAKDKRDLIICYTIFLTSLICANISRIILQSSPYMNDVVSTVGLYVLFFGGSRVLFIFSSIIFLFISISRRNIFLIFISSLNIIVAAMIWLDFDANITAVMRIAIAVLAIAYYSLLKSDGKEAGGINTGVTVRKEEKHING